MSSSSKRAGWLGLLGLLAVAFTLRFVPLDHGQPRNYVPDTHVVRSALGMAKDKNPVPEVGVYSTYPNLLPYTLLPVYAGEFAVGRLTGRFSGVGEFQMHVLEHPERVHGLARFVVLLFGVATALVVFFAARVAGLHSGAWIAAWLTATSTLLVHFSVQERPWGPLVFFLAVGAWFAARHVRDGRMRDLVLCGVAGGLGFATHQAGLPFLGLAGFAWLCGPTPWRDAAGLKRRLLTGVAAVAAFVAVGFLVGHPYLLVHGSTQVDKISGGEGIEEFEHRLSVGGQGMAFAFRPASLMRLSRALFGYDPMLVALGLAGLLGALARRELRPAMLFALVWAALFLTNQNDHVRYLLPVVLLLTLPAGLAGQWLSDRGAFGRALLGLLLIAPLLQAGRLAFVLDQPDTRALAEDLLFKLPEGSRIALDRYGPIVDQNLASLERTSELRELGARERHRVERLTAFGDEGLDVVLLEDWISFDERHRGSRFSAKVNSVTKTPDQLLAQLGVTHILLVDRDPGDGEPPLLIDEDPAEVVRFGAGSGAPAPKLPALTSLGERVWVLDPSPTEAAREARLPTELDFALTSLWDVERPGPRLELWTLRSVAR